MSLLTSKNDLKQGIYNAFLRSRETGRNSKDQDASDKILKELAADLTDVIHNYTMSADVDITLVKTIVPVGQGVQVVPTTGTGATVSPSPSAIHAGMGVLK